MRRLRLCHHKCATQIRSFLLHFGIGGIRCFLAGEARYHQTQSAIGGGNGLAIQPRVLLELLLKFRRSGITVGPGEGGNLDGETAPMEMTA